MNYYNINTALFNYVSLRASLTVAFHPTVKTVGFPGLHFVNALTLSSQTLLFVGLLLALCCFHYIMTHI